MINNAYIVGVTGGSGSGKTQFLRRITNALKGHVCVVSQDDYYHPKHKQPIDNKGIENFDTPESIDLNAFWKDIQKIAHGETIIREEYNYNNPAQKTSKLFLKPSPIIFVEGLFLLHRPDFFDLLDLSIYIEAKDHIKLKRRIVRDQVERGYDLEDVLYRYEYHVSPNYERYIAPFKEKVDLIIPNNHNFEKALDVLIGFLKSKLTVGN